MLSQWSLVSFPSMHVDDAPHAVSVLGKVQTPTSSQSVAPHGAVVGLHAARQQWPTPVVPQTLLVHSLLDAHGAPTGATQNELPADGQVAIGSAQSAAVAHVVLQVVASAHASPPAHGTGSPAMHDPA